MKQKNKRKILNQTYFYTLVLLFLIIPLTCLSSPKGADLIVFSYDRPLQLHTLLSSTSKYIRNLNAIFIIYRSSNHQFDAAYNELRTLFPDAQFIKQGNEPKKDFKPLLLTCFWATDAEHIIFTTDDDIFTDSVDIADCVNTLKSTDAYGFYLRLGTNITHSYFANQALTLPFFNKISADTFSFSFQESKSYWAYPNNVNMTLYKKSTIEPALLSLSYYSPNTLESRWARLYPIMGRGLCFANSKGINIPLNLVQDDWHNKHEAIFTTQELLNLWNQGYTIDLAQFHHINNNAAHMPYIPLFVKRDTHHI